MPVYEYKCDGCGKVIEKHHKINEKLSFALCPKCGKLAFVIPSVSNFHLKGGNWAKEGYGNKK
jgi:putative FmdB family regulatory protein